MTGIISASLTLFSIQVGFPVAGILIGDYFLKNQKDKKIRYALGISAFAFGGWLLSNHITTRYLEDVEITLEAEEGETMLTVKDPTRLIVVIDTSASTMSDYKGRKFRIAPEMARWYEGKTTTDNSPEYSLGKKYHTMAKNMVKTLQPDDFVFLDWNGQGVTYYDKNKHSYNGTGRLESVADFIKEQELDKGDYITTTVIITDHPLTHGLLSRSLHKRT